MEVNLEHVWAAGFWDGEGCVTVSLVGESRRPRLTVSIAQVEIQPLQRFQRAVGYGSILGPYDHNKKNHKPYYVWRVEGNTHLKTLYDMIGPYLSLPKKWQMNEALRIRSNWEKYGRCKNGHRLSQSPKGHWRCVTCQSEQGKKNATARWEKEKNK